MRTNVLSCLRWFEIADRVRNERVDGWLSSPLNLYDSSLDSRWRGFLPIIKLQLWVRRDGLSVDFHAGEPPTSRM